MIKQAERTVKKLLEGGAPIIVAYSGGKDSSIVLNLTLTMAAELKREGYEPPKIIVTHGNTGIENPEVVLHAKDEMHKVQKYAGKHGLRVQILVSHPALNDQWAVRVIGRRNLPTYANSKYRACTVDLKIKPMQRLVKTVYQDLVNETGKEPVFLLGVRFTESASRSARMTERGDSATETRIGKDGYTYLAPIADWSTETVWEYLSEARNALRDTFSDFAEMFRIYAHSGGST